MQECGDGAQNQGTVEDHIGQFLNAFLGVDGGNKAGKQRKGQHAGNIGNDKLHIIAVSDAQECCKQQINTKHNRYDHIRRADQAPQLGENIGQGQQKAQGKQHHTDAEAAEAEPLTAAAQDTFQCKGADQPER